MGKGRLEAFSDGVIAVIITIMVLELKVPHGADLAALTDSVPVFLGYVLSFVFIGIYWNNHHHMLHTVTHVDGTIMWANLHLLFWLSLVPVATGWLGDNPYSPIPTALYGVLLFMCGIAYTLLQMAIIRHHGKDSELGRAVGSDVKGKISQVAYGLAILFAFIEHWVSLALYVAVAVMWFVPDPRIARAAAGDHDH
ncbi:MAG TPA: TMEM175 family protein [Kofleriaceae bacterium]|nr:TMEM175 family protein [Kofleriaceae bacterium]